MVVGVLAITQGSELDNEWFNSWTLVMQNLLVDSNSDGMMTMLMMVIMRNTREVGKWEEGAKVQDGKIFHKRKAGRMKGSDCLLGQIHLMSVG